MEKRTPSGRAVPVLSRDLVREAENSTLGLATKGGLRSQQEPFHWGFGVTSQFCARLEVLPLVGVMTGRGTHRLKVLTMEEQFPWDEDQQGLVERAEVE